jgi:hypothetical protein
MRKPVLTETLQVAIVVHDLEAVMRTYGTPDADVKPDATYP